MIISHTSTAFLLIALIILAILAGGFGFNQLSESGKNIEPMLATIVFLLAFAGLGIRAGLMPAHIWVSLVHPSSPTTTHALSLGIAIKVSVYLMYRFFFQFLEPQAWWGYLVLLVAVSTALVNVWYAISSHDLKTALAYHSIENIGIICVGIGVALVFQKTDRFIATLALVASLYHLLNHAIFKGLLYLGTGAIDNLTHQVVEFHKLGGLIKLYPLTSAMFLIGSFSIAGFPPFNGFISEWLTLQALFSGLTRDPWFIGLPVTLVSLVLLVASFALTAFCFYKIAGLTLLGQPRSSEKERKKWERQDVPWSMGSVMLLMAALCLALGLFPGQVIPHLAFALQPLGSVGTGWDCFPSWNGVRLNVGAGSNGLPVTLILGVALGLMLIPILASLFQQTRRPPIAWNCGAPGIVTQVAQYTSSAVSFLIRDQFGVVSATKLAQAAPDYLPARLPLSHSDRYPQVVIEIFRALDNYLIGWLLNISEDVGRTLQNRDIRRYLAYILIANLVALLLFIGLGK
jgi:hydrogenase-4 component B